MALAYVGLGVAFTVGSTIEHRGLYAFEGLSWIAIGGLLAYRPVTRVTAEGVHRGLFGPGRRFLPWDAIEAVGQPGPLTSVTMLILTNGKVVSLADIPRARSADVAAIGHKPIKPIPYTTSPAVRAEPRRPSQTEVDRNLERRAAALAADRERMAKELAKLKRPRA